MDCASTLGELDLKRIKQSSDGYEAEVAPPNVSFSDLLHKKQTCQKNPQHSRFIPIQEFCIGHLPVHYQDEDVYTYVTTLSKLTVKIEVAYTSCNRPEGYLYYQDRGKQFIHLGTGVVDKILVGDFPFTDKCICELCQSGSLPKNSWIIRVPTAKHLVFDTEEAKHSKVKLFFDEDEEDSSRVKTIYGHSVTKSSKKGDWAFLDCVTHDEALVCDLENTRRQLKELEIKTNRKYRKQTKRMALIVSHPHGCSKQVSIGEWFDSKWMLGADLQENLEGASENNFYTYNTPTCDGCSGAPVRVFGHGGFGGHAHTHCKGFGKHGDTSVSGLGWDQQP